MGRPAHVDPSPALMVTRSPDAQDPIMNLEVDR